MRLLSFFILMAFSFQTFDVPPLMASKNPKTCCARKICLCKHAKGAPCDYKAHKAAEAASLQEDTGGCPFHKGMKKPAMNSVMEQEMVELVHKIKKASAVLTQAPCHTTVPKSSLPTAVRDYEPSSAFWVNAAQPAFSWLSDSSKFYLSPGRSGPDHPPRVLFSL